MDNTFALVSTYQACGDQPEAIAGLTASLREGNRFQTLLGVTGSGKTFTMASVLSRLNRPCLLVCHNKTLAAQLYAELKSFFPRNAVEYFVSYYDYYQPEAYIPQTDTYIEKDSSINERIDRLRLAATTALMTRRDVIIVASVSCIYNLGSPEEYREQFVHARRGGELPRDELLRKLIRIRYERNDVAFAQGNFQVRGDTVEIFPAYEQNAVRVEFFGDTIERVSVIDPVSRQRVEETEEVAIYPAKHFLVPEDTLERAFAEIHSELRERVEELNAQNKLLEAQRLQQRTRFDMEMLREVGYCHGIENYSRHLSGRPKGSRPYTLLDYFPDDFLTIIDESHVTVPQVRGMFNGDRARKQTLVDYGFRLPSCLDNRPLKFEEFERIVGQVLFMSATPSDYERSKSAVVVQQVIRPTGLVDPEIVVRPSANQIEDLIERVQERSARNERVLVTTLTKRMAEDLARYLQEAGIKTNYLHSELDAIERVRVLRNLRRKEFDCVVGVNLLREGLDLPEVSLVCVMDADKEGFLRSATSLIQVAGRAARHVNAQVVMYADTMTGSMDRAISETNRRRTLQLEFNKANGITPRSIEKAIQQWIEVEEEADTVVRQVVAEDAETYAQWEEIDALEKKMRTAAQNMQFEQAILLRDKITLLRGKISHGHGREHP